VGSLLTSARSGTSILELNTYPVYLFHWQIGLMTSFLLFGESFHEFSERGFINWCVSLLIVCMVAILVVKYIDEPIQRIRKKIKERKVV